MALSEKQRANLVAGSYTRLLAENEEALASLYNTFANSITSARSFWQTMSKEEMAHKAQITKLDQKIKNGEWKFKRPKFVTAGIIDSLAWIASKKQDVETHGISMREALSVAIHLESSMIESSFFEVLDGDNAEMIDTIETQASYTRAHLRRLQKEAKRLKWRIFGGRKKFPKGGSKTLTHDELTSNIKASQANMLGMLIAMEEATNKLYITFSKRLEDSSNLWSKLAAEEFQHATMLRTLYKLLENGNLFHNVEHFNRKALEEITELILNAEYDAQHDKWTQYQAVCTALKIELSMVEKGFYSVVTSDAPEFQIISKRLVELTKIHTAKLETEMLRLTKAGEGAPARPSPFDNGD